MNYRLAFDITQQPFDWSPIYIGLAFVLVGFLMLVASRQVSTLTKRSLAYVRIFASIFLVFALTWSLLVYLFQSSTYQRYRTAIQSGEYIVVEGPVENFVPMPYEGHAYETFTVHGVRYQYSDYEVTGAFNQTSSHGGPIRSGIYVRILSTSDGEEANRILRLEVRQ